MPAREKRRIVKRSAQAISCHVRSTTTIAVSILVGVSLPCPGAYLIFVQGRGCRRVSRCGDPTCHHHHHHHSLSSACVHIQMVGMPSLIFALLARVIASTMSRPSPLRAAYFRSPSKNFRSTPIDCRLPNLLIARHADHSPPGTALVHQNMRVLQGNGPLRGCAADESEGTGKNAQMYNEVDDMSKR